jgi:hypothetical protein
MITARPKTARRAGLIGLLDDTQSLSARPPVRRNRKQKRQMKLCSSADQSKLSSRSADQVAPIITGRRQANYPESSKASFEAFVSFILSAIASNASRRSRTSSSRVGASITNT